MATNAPKSNMNVHELVEEIIQDPTIDKLLDRHPRTLKWPEDFHAMVEAQRRARAMFIQNEAEKKGKKYAKQA